jgi:hypothetical protein
MNAHTPGPWDLYYTERGGFQITVDNQRMMICSRNDIDHKADESIANARLIAAAPKLFVFADHPVMDWLMTDGLHHIPEPQRTSVELFLVPLRRAAIVTAEGK